MVKIGDTFRLRNADIDNHLHIIISDPSQDGNRIVTVNFTSWRLDKDQSCIIEIGEHPFVRVRTCIDYRREKLITVHQIEENITNGNIIPYEPVNPGLLGRIHAGAAISQFIPLGSRNILFNQGVIDTE